MVGTAVLIHVRVLINFHVGRLQTAMETPKILGLTCVIHQDSVMYLSISEVMDYAILYQIPYYVTGMVVIAALPLA